MVSIEDGRILNRLKKGGRNALSVCRKSIRKAATSVEVDRLLAFINETDFKPDLFSQALDYHPAQGWIVCLVQPGS